MEYQKRLRLINYVKNNFEVKKNEMIVFHYKNFNFLELITAEKIESQDGDQQLWHYFNDREKLQFGYCLILDSCDRGPYIDFKDEYLNFQEHYKINFCVTVNLEKFLTLGILTQ